MIQLQTKSLFPNFCLTPAPWLADRRETALPRTSRLKYTDPPKFDLVIRVKHVWHFWGRHGTRGLRHYARSRANPSRTCGFDAGDGQRLSSYFRRCGTGRRSHRRMGNRRFFEIPDAYLTGVRENSEGRLTSGHSIITKETHSYLNMTMTAHSKLQNAVRK